MTEEKIIRMAHEYTVGGLEFDEKGLLRFVDIITAAEREACARVAECFEPDEKLDYIEYASTAIRARGQDAN